MTQTWQMTFFLGALLPPSGLEYGHFEKVPSFFFFFTCTRPNLLTLTLPRNRLAVGIFQTLCT